MGSFLRLQPLPAGTRPCRHLGTPHHDPVPVKAALFHLFEQPVVDLERAGVVAAFTPEPRRIGQGIPPLETQPGPVGEPLVQAFGHLNVAHVLGNRRQEDRGLGPERASHVTGQRLKDVGGSLVVSLRGQDLAQSQPCLIGEVGAPETLQEQLQIRPDGHDVTLLEAHLKLLQLAGGSDVERGPMARVVHHGRHAQPDYDDRGGQDGPVPLRPARGFQRLRNEDVFLLGRIDGSARAGSRFAVFCHCHVRSVGNPFPAPAGRHTEMRLLKYSKSTNLVEDFARMTRFAVFPALLAVALTACDGAAPRVPHSVVVAPAHAVATRVGDSLHYRAQVRDADGDVIHEGAIHWSSSDERVATVSNTGLATVRGPGSAEIRATHAHLTGIGLLEVMLEPARLFAAGGDAQTAPGLSRLPIDPAVRVEDAGGTPIPGVRVNFAAGSGSGSLTRTEATSDDHGIASTGWTLGVREGEQWMRAWVGALSIGFTATATAPDLAIATSELERARATVPYRERLSIIGRHDPPLTWSLTAGTLPDGITLDSAGILIGTATDTGFAGFTVTVRDAADREDSRALTLQVCDPPLRMERGSVAILGRGDFAPCPPLLPSGAPGDRYRVAALQSRVIPSGALPTVTVAIRGIGAGSDPVAPARAARSVPTTDHQDAGALQALQALPPALAAGVRVAESTSRHHAALLDAAGRLMRGLGPQAVLTDMRAEVVSGAAAGAWQAAPPERLLLVPYRRGVSCSPPGPATVPALLVGYSDHLAIYQDSVQRDSIPVAAEHARAVLDYYTAYGAETISEFAGEVPDVNGDGRVNVFVSPAVPPEVAGFVWPGDLLSKSSCAASNEMELVYLNENQLSALGAPVGTQHFLALSTVVHEVKHVVSQYNRFRSGSSQPLWIEEGTAEIAAEMSSRKAMDAAGGVARGAMLGRDAYPPREGSIVTPENFGVLIALARTTISYIAAVNSITADYSAGHNYYGTSWHFHRFLGDVYGDAAGKADGELFRTLNDSVPPIGVAGIEEATGKAIGFLLEDYAMAMMLNGTDLGQDERSFRTYDFPSATFELFRPGSQPEGLYPWPVTGAQPAPFRTDIHIGFLAPGGIRFHDFESDGTGTGIELDVSADPFPGLRVAIVRLR